MSSSNNNKQPLDLTKLSPVVTGDLIDESSGAKHPAPGNKLGIPKIKKPVAAERIPSQSVEASSITDVKLRKKNDSCLGIPASSGKCQVL
ncbi:hypothetical protein Tco_0871040 [Tanacetum coccineum]